MKVDRLLNLMLHRRQYLWLPLGTGAGAPWLGVCTPLSECEGGVGTASGDAAGGGPGRGLLVMQPGMLQFLGSQRVGHD